MAQPDGDPIDERDARRPKRAVRVALVVEVGLIAVVVIVAALLPAKDGHARITHALVGLVAGGLVVGVTGALLLTLVVPIRMGLRSRSR